MYPLIANFSEQMHLVRCCIICDLLAKTITQSMCNDILRSLATLMEFADLLAQKWINILKTHSQHSPACGSWE